MASTLLKQCVREKFNTPAWGNCWPRRLKFAQHAGGNHQWYTMPCKSDSEIVKVWLYESSPNEHCTYYSKMQPSLMIIILPWPLSLGDIFLFAQRTSDTFDAMQDNGEKPGNGRNLS